MQIEPFALERYFARYEFAAEYLLSRSDCDGLPMKQRLSYAEPETAELWDSLCASAPSEILSLIALRARDTMY